MSHGPKTKLTKLAILGTSLPVLIIVLQMTTALAAPPLATPTWTDNTALTAHIYGADGLPGPFVHLGKLRWGDQVVIHARGQKTIYEIRNNYLVWPDNQYPLRDEDYDWVMLITCCLYDEGLGDYYFRRVVRAVLVDIAPEG